MIAAAIEKRLAGADGVGDVGASGGDDAPDRPLLVPVERKAPEAPGSCRCDPSKCRGTMLLKVSL